MGGPSPGARAGGASLAAQALAIASFTLSGLAITLFNKWLMSSFHFPILLILTSAAGNFALSFVLLAAFPGLAPPGEHPPPSGVWDIARTVGPAGVLFAADTVLTNASFETLSVALTEVVKSTIPGIVLVSHFFSGREAVSWKKAGVIALLSSGVALTSRGEATFNAGGMVLALGATASGAAKLLYMERGLTRLPPLTMLMYMAPVTCFSLVVPFAALEFGRLRESEFAGPGHAAHTVGMLCAGSLLAFWLNASACAAIAATSSVTLCVAGTARLIIIIGASAALLPGFSLTTANEVGVALSVSGVALYNVIKASERRAAEHAGYKAVAVQMDEVFS